MFAPSVDLRNATLSSRRAEVWVRSSQDIGGVFNFGLGHDRSSAAGWLAALTASQLRTGRKKIGCAPGAGSFSCAPRPDAVPLQSDGVHSNRLTSSFGSFPSRARLGSTCLYGSASFSSLLFFWIPSPEPPQNSIARDAASPAPGGAPGPLPHALAALPVTHHFCLPAGPPSPPTTAESARRRRLPARWPGPMSPAAASRHACSRICHIATGTPSRYCACLGRTRWARCGRVPLHAR